MAFGDGTGAKSLTILTALVTRIFRRRGPIPGQPVRVIAANTARGYWPESAAIGTGWRIARLRGWLGPGTSRLRPGTPRAGTPRAAAPVARFEALLGPAGQELLGYLGQQDVTAGDALRLGTRLRERYPADLAAAGLAQHELRLKAAAKFSRAMQMYFTRPGLEQASGELAARHRSARYAGAATRPTCAAGSAGT